MRTGDREPAGIGGWLLVLCVLLLGWQPLSLALVASAVVDRLPVRGLPFAILLTARVIAAGWGIAAGIALLGRRAGAVALARWSLVAAAVVDAVVYSTPYFPNNRPPGETPVVLAAALAYDAVWFAYLSRSRRVRNTFG